MKQWNKLLSMWTSEHPRSKQHRIDIGTSTINKIGRNGKIEEREKERERGQRSGPYSSEWRRNLVTHRLTTWRSSFKVDTFYYQHHHLELLVAHCMAYRPSLNFHSFPVWPLEFLDVINLPYLRRPLRPKNITKKIPV